MGETRLTLDYENDTFFEALDPIGERVAVDKTSEFDMQVGDVFFCRPTSLTAKLEFLAGIIEFPLFHPVYQEKTRQKDR